MDVDHNIVHYDSDAFVGVKSKVLDTEKLALQFPGHIKTDFEEGIRQTINWLEPLVKKGKL